MKRVAAALAIILSAAAWIGWAFDRDIAIARARASHGSVLVDTRCGRIEYQEAGAGVPLLMVHGSGGGHDQGGHVWVGHDGEVRAENAQAAAVARA